MGEIVCGGLQEDRGAYCRGGPLSCRISGVSSGRHMVLMLPEPVTTPFKLEELSTKNHNLSYLNQNDINEKGRTPVPVLVFSPCSPNTSLLWFPSLSLRWYGVSKLVAPLHILSSILFQQCSKNCSITRNTAVCQKVLQGLCQRWEAGKKRKKQGVRGCYRAR